MSKMGVIVPQPDAVALLLKSFPELRDVIDQQDSPTLIYEDFGRFLMDKNLLDSVWRRAWLFFNDAVNLGPDMEELIAVSVFERLADSSAIVSEAHRSLRGKALKLFRDVETYIEPTS